MKLPEPIVKLSISRLLEEIQGKKLALMMNNSAFTNEGANLIDVMHGEWKADIKFLLGMEHGVRGELQPGVEVDDQTDPITGLPVISLYKFPDLRPPDELLSKVDAVVFCAQDAGVRHWTFTPWMMFCMDTAARTGTEVIILDRPNPIGGNIVEGGVTEPEYHSIIGAFSYPLRHGMTIGELALMYNAEQKVGCKLNVIPMECWTRDMWYDETGLLWTPPSPNLPVLESIIGYATTGLLQSTTTSYGVGTTTPFVMFGAPWLDGEDLAQKLNKLDFPGVFFISKYFMPNYNMHNGKVCSGVAMTCFDRNAYRPVTTALHILSILTRDYPGVFNCQTAEDFDRRAGTSKLRVWLQSDHSINEFIEEWNAQAAQFQIKRRPYLLY